MPGIGVDARAGSCALLLAVAVLSVGTTASLAAGQANIGSRIYGLVLDRDHGKPLDGVRVLLSPGEHVYETGENGAFIFMNLAEGRYIARFERLGYELRVDTFAVARGQHVDISVQLATSPIDLDPISVTVRVPSLVDAGFYERRAEGMARFITAEDIERLQPVELTDLMRRIPSTIVLDGGPGRKMLRFNRQITLSFQSSQGPPGCEPAVFLDGFRIQDSAGQIKLLDFNRVYPSVVAGIEVYVGANTPLKYKVTPCGAVLIWTKRGG